MSGSQGGTRSSWAPALAEVLRGGEATTVAGDQKARSVSSDEGGTSAVVEGFEPVDQAQRGGGEESTAAPRSTSRKATFHCRKARASASGVPPPMTAPGASMSAPASSSASEDGDVVAAGGPVQRGLLVWTPETAVDVGPGRDQDRDRPGAVGGSGPASR